MLEIMCFYPFILQVIKLKSSSYGFHSHQPIMEMQKKQKTNPDILCKTSVFSVTSTFFPQGEYGNATST